MRLGWLPIVALVLLGTAAVLAWTWRDQAQALAAGRWARAELQVVRAEPRSAGHTGGLLFVVWAEPSTGAPHDGAALIDSQDLNAPGYQPGQRIVGWVHPGFWRPVIGETAPQLERDQRFLLPAAAACAGLGLVLLGLAWKTGRILAGPPT